MPRPIFAGGWDMRNPGMAFKSWLNHGLGGIFEDEWFLSRCPCHFRSRDILFKEIYSDAGDPEMGTPLGRPSHHFSH